MEAKKYNITKDVTDLKYTLIFDFDEKKFIESVVKREQDIFRDVLIKSLELRGFSFDSELLLHEFVKERVARVVNASNQNEYYYLDFDQETKTGSLLFWKEFTTPQISTNVLTNYTQSWCAYKIYEPQQNP